MTTATQTPPERCPVCGAGHTNTWNAFTYFECGAAWYATHADSNGLHWSTKCPRAFAIAIELRQQASTPTPLELARQALVPMLREMVDAFVRYEMDVEGEAPAAHRDMMRRAYAMLAALEPAP